MKGVALCFRPGGGDGSDAADCARWIVLGRQIVDKAKVKT